MVPSLGSSHGLSIASRFLTDSATNSSAGWLITYQDGANAARFLKRSPIPVLTEPDVVFYVKQEPNYAKPTN